MFKSLSHCSWGGGRCVCLGIVGAVALLATAVPANAAEYAYVTNGGSGDVSQYNVGSNGLLPLSPPTTVAGDSPQGLAVSPDGRSVYVPTATNFAANFAGELFQYDVGAAGALTPKSPARVNTGDNPRGVAISPDGGSVYVANTGSPFTATRSPNTTLAPGGCSCRRAPPRWPPATSHRMSR